ncbi:hypothetical protein B005_3414 [Nocardiopsis alba ATCC BAA-2165]|uniref:Uncharacterized protein n=1 Tax=Nocardiopsis alba (strain ATCC BAA-2165 / BE74) TaxID=1205910 RepID=J7L337_NOCAA|nr:hypothetical protein B005_3414 [Nocardiopsis alba ATCC BAA-2165]
MVNAASREVPGVGQGPRSGYRNVLDRVEPRDFQSDGVHVRRNREHRPISDLLSWSYSFLEVYGSVS